MRKVGSPKTEGSGRKKGTPNKRTLAITEIIEQSGADPVGKLIELMRCDDKGIALAAARELCQYLFPKRKAVELTSRGFFRREVQKLDGSREVFTNEPKDDED